MLLKLLMSVDIQMLRLFIHNILRAVAGGSYFILPWLRKIVSTALSR